MLYKNKLFISNELFQKFTDFNLKQKSKIIYDNLVKQNINIISIFDDIYPYQLLFLPNAPVVIIYYGNISLMNKRKNIYVHYDNEMDILAKKIYNKINEQIISNKDKVNIISNSFNKEKIGLYNYEGNINFLSNDIFNVNYNFKLNKKECLYIIFDESRGAMYKNQVVASICDFCIFIQADFNKNTCYLVDCFLNLGKNIYAIPWSIYNKKARLSNQLIRDGAICISSFEDLKSIIK